MTLSILKKFILDQEGNFTLLHAFFKMFIYFWERQSTSGGGAEREGDTESEAGLRLPAVSPMPDVGFQLKDCVIMAWAEVGL